MPCAVLVIVILSVSLSVTLVDWFVCILFAYSALPGPYLVLRRSLGGGVWEGGKQKR